MVFEEASFLLKGCFVVTSKLGLVDRNRRNTNTEISIENRKKLIFLKEHEIIHLTNAKRQIFFGSTSYKIFVFE